MDMQKQIQKLKKTIEKIEGFQKTYHSIKSIKLHQNNQLTAQLKFQNHFLQQEKSSVYTQYVNIENNKNPTSFSAHDSSTETLPYYFTQSEDLKITVEWYQEKKENKNTHYFKIIKDGKCIEILETTNYFEHLYIEDQFGELQWNKSCSKVVFVAEKKQIEEQKISKLLKDMHKQDSIENYLKQNNKFHGYARYTDHRHSPQIFILDVQKFKIFKLELDKKQELIPLEPFFDGNENVLFVGIKKTNFQYSIVYCYNRPKQLYRLQKTELKELNEEQSLEKEKEDENQEKNKQYLVPEQLGFENFFTLLNPFFDNNFENLYFMGRKDQFYEHKTYFQLWRLEYSNLDNQNPSLQMLIDKDVKEQQDFNGIVNVIKNDSVIRKNFCLKEKNQIFLQTVYKGLNKIGLFDIDSKKFDLIPEFSDKNTSYTLIQHNKNDIIIEANENSQLQNIYYYNLQTKNKTLLYELKGENLNGEAQNLITKHQKYSTQRIQLENNAEGFIVFSNKEKKGPLLTIIHGGPFSLYPMVKSLTLSQMLMLDMGINLLIINYRGSLSYGYKTMCELIGNAGIKDVQDCMDIIEKAFMENPDILDKEKLAIMGGSHGGFLTGWLTCHEQFSSKVKCSIMLNSVVYGPSILAGSNIPDWLFATLQTNQRDIEWPVSDQNLLKIYNSTCIKKVKNVKCPVLIISGEKDKTVPEDNNKYFYHCLKQYRDDCEFVNYPEDNHQMGNKETTYHYMIKILNFLEQKLLN